MPSELSDTQYAFRRKEILGLVNQLRAVGAQGDLDLPRIAVIGNQSAGKSSVIEAISGIKVPRDAGTCTRCPMECRLSSSTGNWSCRISIRREFDDHGKPLNEISEVRFGRVLKDKNEVEDTLRRAQFAVLNPTIPHKKIFDLTIEQLREWSAQSSKVIPFSRNVVCVALEGPELTDLSFIDLPGLIQNAEPHIVKLVEDLVVSHIKGNCLILVALPMTDDIENQKALRLARQEDPQGRRTIGVLTKPDMLTAGSTKALQFWLDVLEGRQHPLHHGYYCTRQPNDAERSEEITAAQARSLESTFFQETPPWSKSNYSQRFGTGNLIATLSTLLVQVINESLPKIRTEAIKGLDTCRRGLAKIPKTVDDEPATHLLTLLTGFSSEVHHCVQGGSDATALIQANRTAYRALKLRIRSTAPNFTPFSSLDARSKSTNLVDEEEAGGTTERTISEPFTLTHMRDHISRSITRELPNNVPHAAKIALITNFQDTWSSSFYECLDRVKKDVLNSLMESIDARFSRYDLLRAHMKTFVNELIEKHYDSCTPFLEATLEIEREPFTQNTHYLEAKTEIWLSKYKQARSGKESSKLGPTPTSATTAASKIVFDFSVTRQPPAPTTVDSSSGQASFPPFWSAKSPFGAGDPNLSVNSVTPDSPSRDSKNTVFSSPASSVGFSEVPPQDSKSTVSTFDTQKINHALAALVEAGFIGLNAEDLAKLKPADNYETELKVMAEVRGYFQVSYKRVIDNIPSTIDLKFVKAISRELQGFLISKFDLGTANSNDRCAQYLAEDPHIVAKREELLARQKRLLSVQHELDNFGMSTIKVQS